MAIKYFIKLFFCFLIIQCLNLQILNAKDWLDGNVGTFQGLDKITARIKSFSIKVGEKSRFGVLDIKLDKCIYSKPTKMPESVAFIRISDETKKTINSQNNKIIFQGWIFASSPVMNALEHPVYDVTLIRCK